jgi:beta-galactosidase
MAIKKLGIIPLQHFGESLFFKVYAVIFSVGLLPAIAQAQERVAETINSNWSFHKGDTAGLNANAHNAAWEKVSLPHTWNAADVMDDEPGYYRGVGWYKKKLYINPSWKGKDVYVFFEGASQVAEVFINGKPVGNHIGGYNFFSFNISKFLNYNIAANEISVKVDNSYNEDIPPLTADFTFYGGIYRDVYLIAANPVHFDLDNYATNGIFISTPSVSADRASIEIKGALVNTSTSTKRLQVITTIVDKSGNKVASQQSDVRPSAGQKIAFNQSFKNIDKPNLWSPEDPYLYTVISTLIDATTKQQVDEVSNPFGFRWFEFTADKGFFLNGKSYKLIGASRHQDFKDIGNALPDALHVRDVTLLKEMGGNFLRVAHYPQDPAVLQACDRLGIVASVETPLVNTITESQAFTDNSKNMQTEMIRQSYNHPSVVIWAYMNEVLLRPEYEKGSEKQATYFKAVANLAQTLEDLTRKEDPYRYTMIPCHGAFDLYKSVGLTNIPKIVGWNLYSGWYSAGLNGFASFLDKFHAELPGKPVIVTEYGADADARLHSFSPVRFDKTVEYTNEFHKVYYKAMMERPFVTGGAIWNLAEFNSEGRDETMPHINNKGILTQDRRPKDVYLFYQSKLLDRPFIKIGSRSWTLRSGVAESDSKLQCIQPLEVYTDQKKVKLLVNGNALDEVEAIDGVATFKVPFINGTNSLEAISSINGKSYKDYVEVNFLLLSPNLKSTNLPFKEINISLGDPRLFIDEKLQQVWLPEKGYEKGSWGYVGGSVFSMKGNTRQSFGSNKNILGTDYDPIYETQRTGIESFKLDVPDGKYEVTLHFAELLSNKEREALAYNLGDNTAKEEASERTFDVSINNQKVIENLSNTKELIPETAYAEKFVTEVRNNTGIVIDFTKKKGETILNGLQVRKVY